MAITVENILEQIDKTDSAAAHEGELLVLKSIRKAFRTEDTEFEALRGVDLVVRDGEFVSITGESGSGKSTILSILGAISPPSSGTVTIDGIDIYKLPIERLADFRREYIGFVFQQFHLIPYLTAAENVMLPLCISKLGASDMRGQALAALESVGLGGKAARLPSQLSGGEQQRVAVARALVNNPPIIMADEPTGNLDTKTGEEIFGLFKSLNAKGQTVVIVTHNPELAGRTTRTVRMRDGLILQEN